MTPTLRKGALYSAMALGLLAGTANAGVRVGDQLDGNWFDPAQSGRGISFDFVTQADGRVALLAPFFTYDASGNPVWLVLAADTVSNTGSNDTFSEFQHTNANLKVYRYTGGTFSGPQTVTGAVIGTASLDVQSCGQMALSVDMDASTGLADFSSNLVPLSGVREDCVWTEAFTQCPAFSTAAPAYGSRACLLSGNTFPSQVRLTNDITWVIEGQVKFGGDNTNPVTVRIDPGTLLVSTGDTFDHIIVNRGSRIFAEGTASAPIILTSPNELPGATAAPAPTQVGGLVIAGNAPVNCPGGVCTAEFAPEVSYGGSNATESSGIVRYMQVRYSGYIYQTGREINAFTLLGTGSGTTLEYLQAYRGADDGIEFFGGTTNLRYFVDTAGGDDSIDWDEGYSGKIQFALVTQNGASGENHGMELANNPTNFDASPRARPVTANLTLLGRPGSAGANDDGIQFKEGTGGQIHNSVVTGYSRACIRIQDAATFTAAGTPAALTGTLAMQNSVVGTCGVARFQETATGGAPWTAQAWFEAQPGNTTATDLALNGYLPTANSPIYNKPLNPALDQWFVRTDYAGAFAGPQDDWTAGWTKGVAAPATPAP